MNWRIILVLLLAAVVYLAGNAAVGLWDRDEPRYAECSREMLQSGDWVVPRLYQELRPQKPPLIYWSQAAAMKLIGDGPETGAFAARLPSAIAMLLTIALLGIAISRHVGVDQAFWTVFIFSTSLLTIVCAKICLTDSVLLLWSTIAQLSIYCIWRGSTSWKPVIFLSLALALGGLTKPLLLLTLGGTVVVLFVFRYFAVGSQDSGESQSQNPIAREHGRARAPRSIVKTIAQILLGLIIITAIALPWILLIRHRAPEFFAKAAAEASEHLERGKEGHGGPPGFHFVLIWVTFFPWCLLLPLAIGLGIRYRAIPQVRYALAAVIGPWIVLEFFGTKLPHYILATFPALAYLTASAAIHCIRGDDRDTQSRPFVIGAGAWAVVAAGMAIIPWLTVPAFHLPGLHIPKFDEQPYDAIKTLSVMAVIYALIAFGFIKARWLAPALLTIGGGMMVIVLIAFTFYLPRLEFLRTSIHMADLLQKIGATHPGDVIMTDYKEPSLGFYQGGTIREKRHEFFQQKHWGEWPRWMVMTLTAYESFPPESRARMHPVADLQNPVRGLAYSDNGRVVELMVMEKNDE